MDRSKDMDEVERVKVFNDKLGLGWRRRKVVKGDRVTIKDRLENEDKIKDIEISEN